MALEFTPLPIPPSRQRPATFSVEADAFLGALPQFQTDGNAIATQVEGFRDSASASAIAAALSETNAATSASEALASQVAAAASAAFAAEAKATAEQFFTAYLGPLSEDPIVDGNGDPLLAGALYYNTVEGLVKTYSGTVWLAAAVDVNGALLSANNLADVSDPALARQNLGITQLVKNLESKNFYYGSL